MIPDLTWRQWVAVLASGVMLFAVLKCVDYPGEGPWSFMLDDWRDSRQERLRREQDNQRILDEGRLLIEANRKLIDEGWRLLREAEKQRLERSP